MSSNDSAGRTSCWRSSLSEKIVPRHLTTAPIWPDSSILCFRISTCLWTLHVFLHHVDSANFESLIAIYVPSSLFCDFYFRGSNTCAAGGESDGGRFGCLSSQQIGMVDHWLSLKINSMMIAHFSFACCRFSCPVMMMMMIMISIKHSVGFCGWHAAIEAV